MAVLLLGAWSALFTATTCCLQVPATLGDIEDPTAASAGGAACLLTLVAYCIYQVPLAHMEAQRLRSFEFRVAEACCLLACESSSSSTIAAALVCTAVVDSASLLEL